MDDSGSDFQTPKKVISKTEPKPGTSKAPTNTKAKPKKPKYQKTIKKFLQPKKDDLVTYTKEFDKICTASGLDVDSEQLQLAIALSKSLQDFENSSESEANKNERKPKSRRDNIKSTLEEFGFKVPTINKSKAKRKSKPSKLLASSEDAKKQIIATKYSEILFHHCFENNKSDGLTLVEQLNGREIFNKAILSYKEMKDEAKTFYTYNIVEVNPNTMGSLLKDWSKIPGITVSPLKPKRIVGKIEDFLNNINEIDIILSGTFSRMETFLKVTNKELPKGNENDQNEKSPQISYINDLSAQNSLDTEIRFVNEVALQTDKMSSNEEEMIKEDCKTTKTPQKIFSEVESQRNCSPDLFDDDITIIEPSPESIVISSYKNATKIVYDCMDLTECVSSKITTEEVATKNISGCVLIEEDDKISEEHTDQNIDLTASSDDSLPNIVLSQNNTTQSATPLTSISYNNVDHDSQENTVSITIDSDNESFSDNVSEKSMNLSLENDIECIDIENYTRVSPANYYSDDKDVKNSSSDSLPLESEYIAGTSCNEVQLKKSYDSEEIVLHYDDNSANFSMPLKNRNTISIASQDYIEENAENNSCNDDCFSQSSQQSNKEEIFEIQDEEFNFSMIKANELDSSDDLLNNESLPNVDVIKENRNLEGKKINDESFKINHIDYQSSKTPTTDDFIVKTVNITPMLDFDALTTPQRNLELDKFGIKPLKRRKAIRLLEHLYSETHPLVDEVVENPSKRMKINSLKEKAKERDEKPNEENVDVYTAMNLKPKLVNICEAEENWFFPKKEKAKMQSCCTPLHIVFFNYISARPLLRAKILKYEPIEIDLIHKQLAQDGYRFDSKDLLKFMDRKCITVKTQANNGRNGKRTKKKINKYKC